MRIVKHGRYKDKKPVTFTCRCGCVFECQRHEFKVLHSGGELFLFADCPECCAIASGDREAFEQMED